ncbi:PhoH family protein [Fusicatenibacter saccharivorans]|uniref:PhoH family protein n=1 Tax=Fusicatenibacter saccharivorans TaxID=1150298 RepID=UPI0034A2FF0C
MKTKFYDTNALLLLQDKILEDNFYISSTTLEELENIKTSSRKDEETKYKARKLLHILDENSDKYKVVITTKNIISIIDDFGLENTPDNQICACAYSIPDILFITNDISCKTIAKWIFGLDISSISTIQEDLYKGYRDITLSENDMAYFYEHLNENVFNLLTNEYVIIRNADNEVVDKLKWDGEMYQTIRNKPFKSNMFGTLKPLDDIQSFAMDSINTNDITVLYGKAGSGKTTLPLNYIMQEIEKGRYKKCYMVYSYEPLKGAKTLGYEKGDHVTKLIYSASIGNILASKFGDLQQVEYMLDRGMLDIIPTANIRGVEFESDSICMVTESQNLDVYTLKTIIQRCKSGCKQIYEGDIIEQKDTNIQNVGINRLIDVFKGHKSFGCVKLKNNYRSELSELADLM